MAAAGLDCCCLTSRAACCRGGASGRIFAVTGRSRGARSAGKRLNPAAPEGPGSLWRCPWSANRGQSSVGFVKGVHRPVSGRDGLLRYSLGAARPGECWYLLGASVACCIGIASASVRQSHPACQPSSWVATVLERAPAGGFFAPSIHPLQYNHSLFLLAEGRSPPARRKFGDSA